MRYLVESLQNVLNFSPAVMMRKLHACLTASDSLMIIFVTLSLNNFFGLTSGQNYCPVYWQNFVHSFLTIPS